jgi:1-aminocyclopropane-1-carboxylate deaminase
MDIIEEGRVIVQPLPPEWHSGRVNKIDILRLDLVHPLISGNKWYKLKYNLAYALQGGYSSVLTFGGAYSNHLHATAVAAKQAGLTAIGVVRGLHAADNLTPTLLACREYGMELRFVSREDYAMKESESWLQELARDFNEPFIIPEGGANVYGREGAGEIGKFIAPDYTHVCISVGTGTSFIGIRNSLPTTQTMLGFAPMKGGSYLKAYIANLLDKSQHNNWLLFDEWHYGGFGKWTEELVRFMNDFYSQNHVPLDVVYTAKMMSGVKDLIEQDFFPPSANILCIHTGGLQGNASVQDRLISIS